MSSIPKGFWDIESVIINNRTVLNDDSIRCLEIHDDEWVIQPARQRFRVRQTSTKSNGLRSAVLESKGEVYFADFKVSGSNLVLTMSRQNVKEVVTFECVAITADVFSRV